MPFFSVIIPSYNRAHFLEKTIGSVLNQSFIDYEILLVDDGSTDYTKELVSRLSAKDDRLVYIEQSNKDRGAARNNGIRQAKGKYAVFLDSDDLFYPNHLGVLYQNIQKNPSVYFFATKYEYQREKELVPHPDLVRKKEGFYDYKTFIKGNFLSCNLCIALTNSSLILFNEDRQLTRCEDWLFLIVNLYKTELFLIDETTVCMIDHSDRSMNQNYEAIIKSGLHMAELLNDDFLESEHDIKFMKGSSYYFCAIYSRLNGQKIRALNFLFQSIRCLGFTKNIILLFLRIILK